MKFIHLSDIHIGVETHGKINPQTGRNTRLEDVLRSLDKVVETALEESVDLVLVGGDVFHRENPDPTQETEFAKRVRTLVTEGGARVAVVLGNHDYPIAMGRAAALEIFPALNLEGVFVARRPDLILMDTKGGPIQVACLPWTPKSYILTKEEYKELSADSLRVEIEMGVSKIINDLARRADTSLPTVFLGHLAVRDAKLSGTEATTLLASDPTVGKGELANPAFAYVALGHVHKFQDLNEGFSPPVVYPGSIERIDFSEEKEPKGFVVGEVFKDKDGGRWTSRYEFRETPARRFLTIEVDKGEFEERGDITEVILRKIQSQKVRDAVVRVRYTVSGVEEVADEKQIRKALMEAYSVKIERNFEKVSKTIRQIGISGGMDIIEALSKYIKSNPSLQGIEADMKEYARELLKELKVR